MFFKLHFVTHVAFLIWCSLRGELSPTENDWSDGLSSLPRMVYIVVPLKMLWRREVNSLYTMDAWGHLGFHSLENPN